VKKTLRLKNSKRKERLIFKKNGWKNAFAVMGIKETSANVFTAPIAVSIALMGGEKSAFTVIK
tara:strand:+ start:6540 stop:6728 length:189 start_codon:yes stop_codon:yes gene_type:complete